MMVRTALTFLEDLPQYQEEKPYRFVGFPNLPKQWQSNCQYIDHENICLSDVRRREEKLSLDGAGFRYLHHKSNCDLDIVKFSKVSKDTANLDAYLEESMALVQSEMGEQRVMCFDWRVS